MMKWGRRRSSSASSSSFSAASGPSFMSHASPFSWLSKFKQMRINSEPNHGKMKHKAKQNSTSAGSPQYSCGNGGRFYVGDGDALWRTRPSSFGEENHEDKKSEDIDEESVLIPTSSFPNSSRRNAMRHGTREGTLKFKEEDIGLAEERKLLNGRKVSIDKDENNREKEYEQLRRRFERKAQEVLQEQLLKLEREAAEAEFASSKVVEKDVLQFDSPRTICTPRTHYFASFADSNNSSNFKVRSIVESYEKSGRQYSQKKMSSEKQNLKQSEELKVKTNRKRETHDVSRGVQRRKPSSSRVRIYSPRMASKVEVCRIKALEDMRKAKLKMKKLEREKVVVEETHGSGSDSFAVIKCSLDPKQDFRDSMIEMIMENQIRHPEEMEELLACYLTLNADEYHDLIIKVFRQVWFDMSQGGFGIKTNMQCSFCE